MKQNGNRQPENTAAETENDTSGLTIYDLTSDNTYVSFVFSPSSSGSADVSGVVDASAPSDVPKDPDSEEEAQETLATLVEQLRLENDCLSGSLRSSRAESKRQQEEIAALKARIIELERDKVVRESRESAQNTMLIQQRLEIQRQIERARQDEARKNEQAKKAQQDIHNAGM